MYGDVCRHTAETQWFHVRGVHNSVAGFLSPLWQLRTNLTTAQCWAGVIPGHPAHVGPHILALPLGPCPSHGEGLISVRRILHPSPGGTWAQFTTTAIPRELQNKPDAPVEIDARFSSFVRNQAPLSAPGSGTPTRLFFLIEICLFFHFHLKAETFFEEIMT